jgi:hypothetical protein
MADITLAEYNGSVWLVGGEAYLDDLLINALPDGISIELVPCERKGDVHAMWHRLSGEPDYAGDPWMIHPAIVQRIRGTPPATAIVFKPWIVMPDEDGMRVIARAAAEAAADPDSAMVLAAYVDPDATAAAAELANLRLRMIEDALERENVPRARITREQRDAASLGALAAGSGRVDIVVTKLGGDIPSPPTCQTMPR